MKACSLLSFKRCHKLLLSLLSFSLCVLVYSEEELVVNEKKFVEWEETFCYTIKDEQLVKIKALRPKLGEYCGFAIGGHTLDEFRDIGFRAYKKTNDPLHRFETEYVFPSDEMIKSISDFHGGSPEEPVIRAYNESVFTGSDTVQFYWKDHTSTLGVSACAGGFLFYPRENNLEEIVPLKVEGKLAYSDVTPQPNGKGLLYAVGYDEKKGRYYSAWINPKTGEITPVKGNEMELDCGLDSHAWITDELLFSCSAGRFGTRFKVYNVGEKEKTPDGEDFIVSGYLPDGSWMDGFLIVDGELWVMNVETSPICLYSGNKKVKKKGLEITALSGEAAAERNVFETEIVIVLKNKSAEPIILNEKIGVFSLYIDEELVYPCSIRLDSSEGKFPITLRPGDAYTLGLNLDSNPDYRNFPIYQSLLELKVYFTPNIPITSPAYGIYKADVAIKNPFFVELPE